MFDAIAASRQYGVVDVSGQSAGFTGTSTLAFADDVQGSVGAFTYSIQGNILTGGAVLSQAVAGFETPGCDLAARLMAALEAGGNNGQGDSRCTDDGIPSDSAFLQVDVPDAPLGSFLSLRVPSSGSQNPLSLLRAQFDVWRSSSPCPVESRDAGGGAVASDSAAPLDVTDAASAALPPTASVPLEPQPPPASATPEPPNDASAPPPVVAARARSSAGCRVSHAGEPSTSALAALGGLAFALSRRRSSRASARRPVSPV
jgi:MYXO-CTERM domain-containing protein